MGLGSVPKSVVVSRHRLAGLALAMLAAWGMPAVSFAEAPIRIGAPLPLTGALSPEGVKLQQGYELWKDTVNAAGGIAVGAIKRSDFDMKFNQALGSGNMLVGDTVTISLGISAIKQSK